jgi:HTH-type transcriptional repressor of NAD biosynthesis genes
MKTTGFILGKFLPPHKGHQYLGDFALNYCDQLTILVCSMDREPIPGPLRFQWMQEMFPRARVMHMHRDIPQYPEEHPDFWNIWRDVVKFYHPEILDYVFASETYGHKLAEVAGAEFVMVDPGRETIPTSGTEVRSNPFKNWWYLARPVRPYFTKKICVFGPESTGKSTLTKNLAKIYNTSYVPEYGRIYTETYGTDVKSADLLRIQHGHIASTSAALREANRILFLDTDPIMTCVWADMLVGHRDGIVERHDVADLYLLCGVDVPWVDDGTRYFPVDDERRKFYEKCKQELIDRKANFVEINGSWDERLVLATKAVDKLL